MAKQERIVIKLVQAQKITTGTHLDSPNEDLSAVRLLTGKTRLDTHSIFL